MSDPPTPEQQEVEKQREWEALLAKHRRPTLYVSPSMRALSEQVRKDYERRQRKEKP